MRLLTILLALFYFPLFGQVSVQHENGNSLLGTTLTALYEYKEIWAEESGGARNNSSQWSYGNGSDGFIGIPIDDGWEVVAMYFQSDLGGDITESMEVHLVDMGASPSAAAPIIATVNIDGSGQGIDNNPWIFKAFATPVPVPNNTFIGFRTGTEVGAWSDLRVGVRMRRKVGDYVSDIKIN